jgi:hypothetical protein
LIESGLIESVLRTTLPSKTENKNKASECLDAATGYLICGTTFWGAQS